MDKKDEKAFELYKQFVELGKYEVLHAMDRFYNTSKLHLTILGGMAILVSYSVAEHQPIAFILSLMAAVFGIYNAYMWLGIITSSASWEGRWFFNAGKIEQTDAFREQTSLHLFEDDEDFPGISNKYILNKMENKKNNKGNSARFYRSFAKSLIFFYLIFILFAIFYKFSSIDRIGWF